MEPSKTIGYLRLESVYTLTLLSVLFCSCKDHFRQGSENSEHNSITNLTHQEVSIDSIDHFIIQKMADMNITGLSLAIINDGKIAYHTVNGYADLEEQRLVDEQTVFEGASLSKPLFAYTTMFLVEEGKLDLDKPLSDYLKPQFHNIFNHDSRYRQITARMVLSHTTGFPNWREDGDLLIQFDPGTDFNYSGEGYQYLVYAAESILQTNYQGMESFYQEKVASPLNMKRTKYIQDEHNYSHKATGYRNGEKLPIDHRGEEFSAAAGIYTESVDFSKWLIALMDETGLSENSHEALFTDQITSYDAPTILTEEGAIAWTLGLAKFEITDKMVYGHLGNNDGYSSLFLMDKEKKWGLVLFTNTDQVAEEFGFDLFRYLDRF